MKGFGSYKFLDCSLIKISHENAYRFMSVCAAMNVDFFDLDLRMQEDTVAEYFVYVKNNQMNMLSEASSKTGIPYEVVKEFGILSFLRKKLKRKLFVFALIAGGLILFLLTQFIWQINISGCIKRSDDEILEVINDIGIHYGVFSHKCDCDLIEEAIRNKFEDVLWVTAAIDGTGLFIQIKENTYLNDKLAINDNACDLVSDTDGTVVRIVTREGIAKCAAGDEVKKGDILISGIKEYYNDAKELYKTEHIYADGDVYARCVKSYQWEFKRNIRVKKYTKKKYGFEISLFNKAPFGYQPHMKNKFYNRFDKKQVLVLGNDLYMPVNIHFSKYKIYEYKKESLSDENLIKLAKIYYLMFCEKERLKGVDIIEKNATIKFNDNSCTVNVGMITEEKIGVHKDITVEEIEIKKPEEND